MKKVVVYDFDGTITNCDTFPLFVKFVKGSWYFAFVFLLFSPMLVLMKLKLYDADKVKESIFSFVFKGMDYTLFKRYCVDFANVNRVILRPKALESISELSRMEDTRQYIVSASIKEWIVPFFNDGDFHDVIATEVEVDSYNCLTGQFKGLNCNRGQKIVRLLDIEPLRKEYHLTVFGDSSGDTPLIKFSDCGFYNKFK